ncbi:hypothetical protein BKA65DRAFT_552678 [Rhexocercosporidium sp. MPI-PUGE-AT-0058]|nr:hypothetical protein BKA65DRAFT_552678 [Rhexocercosporidium sp. MPI-PUGE-AT-0058]
MFKLGVGLTALLALTQVVGGENKSRRVTLVTTDIVYVGINFTVEGLTLVDGVKKRWVRPEKFAHWSIRVGEGSDAVFFDIMSENLRKGNTLRARKWTMFEQSMITATREMGLTNHTDTEITTISNEVIRKKPTYNLFNNNCQDFAITVLDQICNVKQTASQSDRVAFARILSAFLVGTILI